MKSREELLQEVSLLRQQVEQLQATSRQREVENRALLNAMPDLMIQVKRDGTFVDMQVGALSPYMPPSQLMGKKIGAVFPAALAHSIMHHIELALSTGKTQVFEHTLPTLSGVRDYEARMVVSGADEVLVVVRDVADRKRAERQAARSERLATLGLLAAALAHEINNPLQIIQSHLDLLLDFPVGEEERDNYLRIMRHQIDRLNAITSRVLNYARPAPAVRQRIAVARLVRQMLVLASKQLQQSGIQLTTSIQPVPKVLVAPDQLDQVLLNLVINAIESAPPNGRIHVSIYPDGEGVAISIRNNGPPIPANILPHLFEPFFTTKAEGSGLGLWVSYNLVQQNGGQITAENLPHSEGVAFIIKLPPAPAEESDL
ncbi:MAG: ATP-binding protein [Chloroflexota bacterium]